MSDWYTGAGGDHEGVPWQERKASLKAATAVGNNLLRNPGCEEGAHQKSRHWTPDGGPFFDTFDNIWPPIGWTAWWIDRRVNDGSPPDQKTGRPEFHTLTMPPFPDSVRLRSGQNFAMMQTFYRTHYAGWLQQKAVIAGRRYRFSIYAHSWYSDCSTKPHTGPLLDDCRTPAYDSFDTLQVGIGPGGNDQSPLPDEIVWSEPEEIYGGYAASLVVEATAQTDDLTVWMRSWTNYALKHEDVYFDDASLIEIDVPPPPIDPYKRTYVLLPDYKPFRTDEQLRITALNPGVTIGPSADDAAIPHSNLAQRTIISYKPQTWPGGKAGLENHWRLHYGFPRPGDVIEYREDDEPPPPNPLLLAQRDPEWANVGFGDSNCDSDIGHHGCFITSLAMWRRAVGLNADETPVTVDGALGPAGYSGCVAAWRANPDLYAQALRVRISDGTIAAAHRHMDDGGLVLIEVEPQTTEHFVLALRWEDDAEGDLRYWVRDPWYNYEGWLHDKYPGAQSFRLLSQVTPPQPPDKAVREGLHMQAPDGDWLGYVRQTAGPMKFVNMWSELLMAKRANPAAPIGFRQWVKEQPIGVPDKDTLMHDYVGRFLSDMTNVCDILTREGFEEPFFGAESYNETYAVNAPSLWDAVECDRAFVRNLAATGLPVYPIVFCAAVGNPQLPSEDPDGGTWPHILQLARETAAQGGSFGYHCFSADTEILTELGWRSFPYVCAMRNLTVATLNNKTGAVEYQEPTNYWEHRYEGEMVHLFGKTDVLVTPNHRMWIRTHWQNVQVNDTTDHLTGFEFREAQDLPGAFETKRDLGQWEGIEQESFVIPGYSNSWLAGGVGFTIEKPPRMVAMDDWLRFFGYWITEGSCHKGSVSISQSPGEICDKIGEACTAIGYDAEYYHYEKPAGDWYIGDVRLAAYLRQFGKACAKFVPRELLGLPIRQLRILFNAMMEGDGSMTNDVGHYYCTASQKLADDFQELALKIGMGATVSQHCDGYYYVILAKERLTPMTDKKYIERVGYSGPVYCVTVPNGLVFVRRNGKPSWQGNSYWYANPGESGLVKHWPWLSGRWQAFDDYLTAHGVEVGWFFGETGAVGGHYISDAAARAQGKARLSEAALLALDMSIMPTPNVWASDWKPDAVYIPANSGYVLLPHDGWRSPKCYGGDWARYEHDLVTCQGMIQDWNSTHGNRAAGSVIFTVGAHDWEPFLLRAEEMRKLARAVMA